MLPPAKAAVEPFGRVGVLSNRVVVQKSGEPQRKQWLVEAFFCWSRSHMEGTKIITHLVVIPNGVIGQVREQLPVARVLTVVPPMRPITRQVAGRRKIPWHLRIAIASNGVTGKVRVNHVSYCQKEIE